jgi:hypothetical protein
MTSVFRFARQIRTCVDLLGNRMTVKLLGFFLLGVFLSYYVGFSCTFTTIAVFGIYLATGGWKFMKVVIVTLPRDLRFAVIFLC